LLSWVVNLRRSIELYFRLIGVQIRSQLHYRASFLFEMVTTFFGTIINFVTLALILQRFGSIAGWSLSEVAFLYGMVESAFGTMDLIFSGFDPQGFGRQVRLGRLDQMLLRPVDIMLQVLSSELALRRIGRISQGLVILILAISWLSIEWTTVKMIYLPIIFTSQVLFFGALFLIGSTITFWTIDSFEVINIFTYGGSEMMSYPMHIYTDWMRRFFTYIVPAIFLNYYPTLFILGKPDPFHMPSFAFFLSPLVGLGVFGVALSFWRFGLRNYHSTGT
jgi:ABC-2 type transport system permease protein